MATNKVNTELQEKCRVITPEFRSSYPHLFKANAVKGSAPKYSVTMLFKKTQDLATIKEAIRNAKIVAFGPNKADWPTDLQSPVDDGDSPKYAGKEGYAGHWAIKASSNEENRPGLVDENVQPILDQSQFLPGDYARAQVFARVWEYMGKRGIHFILDCVQKTREGKHFGGKKSAAEVFGPISGVSLGAQAAGDDEDDSESFI